MGGVCSRGSTAVGSSRPVKSRAIPYAVSHYQGRRETMEDRHAALANLDECTPSLRGWLPGGAGVMQRKGYFAVFDGHGGHEISAFVEKTLYDNIMSETFSVDVTGALVDGFRATETACLEFSRANSVTSGSTACVVFVLGSMLFVGHVGDSTAVLARQGSALVLTTPHNVGVNSSEVQRVEEQGGTISQGRLIHPEVPTISIEVSRSFGDIAFKDKDFVGDAVSGLIAEPEIRQEPLYDGDTLLFIACDGLWDVITPQEAVTLATEQVERGLALQEVCDYLVTEALKKGSTDNVTLLICVLNPVKCRLQRLRL